MALEWEVYCMGLVGAEFAPVDGEPMDAMIAPVAMGEIGWQQASVMGWHTIFYGIRMIST